MNIKSKGKIISIEVQKGYIYDAELLKIGKPDDFQTQPTMYGWIKHLREKRWWSTFLEEKFILTAKKIFNEK